MKPFTHLALACVGLVVATGFCAYEFWRAQSLEAALAEANRPRPSVVRVRRAAPDKPAESSTTTAPPASPAGAGELPARVREIIERAPRGPGGVPNVRPEAVFADLPAVKLAFSKAAEGQQRLGYAQFIRTVGLSPAEEQRFIEILANREAVWGDIRATATNQGLRLTDGIVAQMDEKNFAETENNLRVLLGAERYEQLQKYRETLDSRLGLFCLSALVQTSYTTDQPLTLDQMNRLATLTTETGVLSYEQAMKMPNGPDFDRALAEAQKFLTPAQMEVFGLLVDQRQISHTLSRIAIERRK
jgi:hypothetical protein